jgi:hypothetical protein
VNKDSNKIVNTVDSTNKINVDSVFNFNLIYNRISNSYSIINKKTLNDDDCVRGLPEKILINDKLKYHKFILNDSLRIGEEFGITNNDDTLYIINKGCEYYVLEFYYCSKIDKLKLNFSTDSLIINSLFEISKYDNDTTKYNEINTFIRNELNNGRNINQEIEYVLDSSIIGTYFKISKTLKENNDRFFIHFEYFIGPL